MAKIEISTSLVLVNLIVFDFSNLSANWPEKPENNRNGRMNIPAIKDTSERSDDDAIFELLNVIKSYHHMTILHIFTTISLLYSLYLIVYYGLPTI